MGGSNLGSDLGSQIGAKLIIILKANWNPNLNKICGSKLEPKLGTSGIGHARAGQNVPTRAISEAGQNMYFL